MASFLIFIGRFDNGLIPVRQRPPEGQFYVVVEGRPNGPFCSIIESIPHYHFESKVKGFAPGDVAKDEVLGSKAVSWVGWNKALLYKETKYDKWERLPNSEKWGLVAKTRKGNAIYFQYLMATKAENLETKGNWKVDIIVTFSVRLMNPVLALFIAGSWEAQVTAAIQGAVREYAITKSYDELLREKAVGGTDDLIKKILDLNTSWTPKAGSNATGLLALIGIEIVTASFVEVELTADSKKEKEAAAAEAIAEAEGKGTIKKAEADGKAQLIRAENENKARTMIAQGIKAEYEARNSVGDNGPAYTRAEAAREVGNNMAAAIKVAKPRAIGGKFMVSLFDEADEKHDRKTAKSGK